MAVPYCKMVPFVAKLMSPPWLGWKTCSAPVWSGWAIRDLDLVTIQVGDHTKPEQWRSCRVDASPLGVCRAPELICVLPYGGLHAQDVALDRGSRQEMFSSLGGAKSRSSAARQKVACLLHCSHALAVEPHSWALIQAQQWWAIALRESPIATPQMCRHIPNQATASAISACGLETVSWKSMIQSPMRGHLNCMFNSCTIRSMQGRI